MLSSAFLSGKMFYTQCQEISFDVSQEGGRDRERESLSVSDHSYFTAVVKVLLAFLLQQGH